MEILLLTVFLSLLLAVLFLLLFLRDRRTETHRSMEQESLSPFATEIPVETVRK
ncbi:hypothetical protein [Cerasicoccus arenae]|uniref:Uncharacterized protein n=1 Tax=Cerasicoccus arenae TaxID=424488 RepID=A0A8J3DD55_9BACT|nr:hypothetical protein [Cerasicoccus arenae]MBK1857646.1 hypothetical protein [Cerasicoccus arenae]GHC05358.1 hypothetical protein GCM10007047_22810 [Cerasicoccus arenae]